MWEYAEARASPRKTLSGSVEDFRDYSIAKGVRNKNWLAAWQGRVRRAIEWGQAGPNKREYGRSNGRPSVFDL